MTQSTTPEFICNADDCDFSTTEFVTVARAHVGTTGHSMTAALDNGTTVTVSVVEDDEENDWDDEA